MKIQPVNKINYKGVPVADIKVKGSDLSYRLYELNRKDDDFLQNMYNSVDLKKLMPKLNDNEYEIWDWVLKRAVRTSFISNNKTILETCNNKPCGIMNYKEQKSDYYLNYITTFPTEPEKKVPFAGQILINELFRRFLDSEKTLIELSALRYSPFSPVSKYLQLGFKMYGGDEAAEVMKINKDNAISSFKLQNTFLDVQKLDKNDNIDLYNTLDFSV